jgi:hypothetical protein
VLSNGADSTVGAVFLGREDEVGSTVGGAAMRKDTTKSDPTHFEPRTESQENSGDGGPELAVVPLTDEGGSVAEKDQHALA